MNNKEIASLLKEALGGQDSDAVWFAIGELEKDEAGESKSDRIEQLVKLNHLVRQVGAIEPFTADPLEILSIFRELRWAVGAIEDSIMGEKFPKEAGE
jgi:hypothetical protein